MKCEFCGDAHLTGLCDFLIPKDIVEAVNLAEKHSAREPDAVLDEEDEVIPEPSSAIDFKITFNGLPRPKRIEEEE